MEHPQRIGSYQIQEFLGGGMGRVYRARDLALDMTVAIKILTPEDSEDDEAKARFLREARTAASLKHQNCLTVYSFGEEHGSPYMVMEFLSGDNLGSAIKNGTTGDLRNKLNIALNIARGLEHLASKGIIHRDIKPGNIQFDDSGVAKLIDFGIAKKPVDITVTQPGMMLGTAPYMAPEQILGKDVTPLVDVYAFGLLLFELLTGQRAIQPSNDWERLFYQILEEPLDLAPLRTANVPEPICDLVRRCTEKQPGDRPQGFDTISREIQTAIQTLGETSQTRPHPDISPWTYAVAGILAVALILVVVLAGPHAYRWLYRQDKDPTPVDPDSASNGTTLPPTRQTETGVMVLIPADAGLGRTDVTDPMPSFYIDRTEVTNGAFQKYCMSLAANAHRPIPCLKPSGDSSDYPVVNITIGEAKDFALWAGKRLPTLKEWERAARGTDGSPFPWGDQRDPTRANVKDNPTSKAALVPAAAFPEGDSRYGVRQMVGNVWEFINETKLPDPQNPNDNVKFFLTRWKPTPRLTEPWYTIMGGAWNQDMIKGAQDSYRSLVPDSFYSDTIGFRCVKDLD
jgi:serine/threonine-protein kinase